MVESKHLTWVGYVQKAWLDAFSLPTTKKKKSEAQLLTIQSMKLDFNITAAKIRINV